MRNIRDTTADKMHLLSCRTRGAELLLVPTAELTDIVGGVIARYQAVYELQIFAIIVLSNHFHILARGPEGCIPLFFECVNKEITLRVNRYLGREGSLWSRRYDDLEVVEEADVLEALLYTVTNNVKHGLGKHPKNWPGVCSYWQSVGGKDRTYRFCNYTAYSEAKRRGKRRGLHVRKSDYEIEYTLEITPLSELPYMPRHVVAELPKLIEQRVARHVRERASQAKGFISRKDILAQPLQGVFPRESNKTNRPICYTRNPAALKAFAKERRLRRAAYTDASIRFRLGNYQVSFPPYTLKPPLHHRPKAALPPT